MNTTHYEQEPFIARFKMLYG